MPTGPIIDAVATLLGALLGGLFGNKIPDRLRRALPLTFGAASMAMGIVMTVKAHSLPPVIFALLIGSAIGELLKIESGIECAAGKLKEPVQKFFHQQGSEVDQEEFLSKYVSVLILFSASGTGIFGALNEGLTHDTSVLISKAFLDFFTSGIFAAAIGYIVTTTVIPQIIILVGLYFLSHVIMPLIQPYMIADFSACGGIIMFVTGLRIAGIKNFPIANMLPALVLVMFVSYYWQIIFIH